MISVCTCQEQRFQQCSCEEGIDVAWNCGRIGRWSACGGRGNIRIACGGRGKIRIAYHLYGDSHSHHEMSHKTQCYHCDDEGLRLRVKACAGIEQSLNQIISGLAPYSKYNYMSLVNRSGCKSNLESWLHFVFNLQYYA